MSGLAFVYFGLCFVGSFLGCLSQGDGTLRLAGGCARSGRVEVFYGGQWGVVCDDAFGRDDADTFCRFMGFASATADDTGFYIGGAGYEVSDSIALFGEGAGPILLDDVNCAAGAVDLADCFTSPRGAIPYGEHNCIPVEAVGLTCVDREIPEVAAGDGTNLALGRPVVQSSTGWDAPAYRGVDGVADTDVITHTYDKAPWWSVDLGDIYDVTSIVITNRVRHSQRLDGVTAVVSTDEPTSNTGYDDLASYPLCGAAGTTRNVLTVTLTCAEGATGRFVYLYLPTAAEQADPYVSVAEVQVFA